MITVQYLLDLVLIIVLFLDIALHEYIFGKNFLYRLVKISRGKSQPKKNAQKTATAFSPHVQMNVNCALDPARI